MEGGVKAWFLLGSELVHRLLDRAMVSLVSTGNYGNSIKGS